MKKKVILNENIRGNLFRLVHVDVEGYKESLGILDRKDVFKIAQDNDLDVLLVNSNVSPACVKILNWEKAEYNRKKKEGKNKKQKNNMKEIRISPNISDHDLAHKSKKVNDFLIKGSKVKITMMLKGRHKGAKLKDAAELKMLQFMQELDGVPESLPKMVGNKFLVIIKPKK